MSDPTLTPFLQTLLDNARLGSPITFDGAAMTAASAVAPPVTTYDASGWSTTATEIGGRRSKGVDALIAELTAAGCDPAIVAEVSPYHVVRSWGGPKAFGFDKPDDRFSTPDPAAVPLLTTDQIYQIIENLIRLDNRLFAALMGGNFTQGSDYRGQVGHEGYRKADLSAGSYIAPSWVQSGFSPLDVAAQFMPHARTDSQQPPIKFLGAKTLLGQQGRPSAWNVDITKHFLDHDVYNVYIDTRDDAAITRMWRSWVIAVGAGIAP